MSLDDNDEDVADDEMRLCYVKDLRAVVRWLADYADRHDLPAHVAAALEGLEQDAWS